MMAHSTGSMKSDRNMQKLLATITVLYFLHLQTQATGTKGLHSREYCQWQTFNASCGSHHVVVIESAQYGRMRLGGCLQRDYGYVGCKEDVRDYLDSCCSGRHSCSLPIPDPILDRKKPCPDDLKAYLQASFSCLSVQTRLRQTCHPSMSIHVHNRHGYLASVVTQDTGLGSEACPWVIRGQPGQTVSISLLDFASGIPNRETDGVDKKQHNSGICQIYATIKEHAVGTTSIICGGQQRQSTIYESVTESVEIEVANMKMAKSPAYFLLKYEVRGCMDMEGRSLLLLDRVGSRTWVTCRTTGIKWKMDCVEDHWVGNALNCTDSEAWKLTDYIENTLSLPQEVLIIIIIGIALLIALVILAVGIWSLQRHYTDRTNRKNTVIVPSIEDNRYCMHSRGHEESPSRECYPMLSSPDHGQRECTYRSSWVHTAPVPTTAPLDTPPPGYGDGVLLADLFTSFHLTPCQENVKEFPTTLQHEYYEHVYESPTFARRQPPDEDLGLNGNTHFYHL